MPEVKLFSMEFAARAEMVGTELEQKLSRWLREKVHAKKNIKILSAQTSLTARHGGFSGILTITYTEDFA